MSARARAVAGAGVCTCSCASRVSDTSATTRYVRGSSGSMSEGADSVTRTRGDSPQATSAGEGDAQRTTGTATPSPPSPPLPPPPPPPPMTYTGRRPRFGTGGPPPSPYMWIDGRQLRSALAWTKKWPMRPPDAVPLRVSFPANDNHLVTSYLEPANPWRHGEYCRPSAIYPWSLTWLFIRFSIIDRISLECTSECIASCVT